MYHGHHTQSWAFTLGVISSQHSSRILITLTTLYSSGPSGQKRPWSPTRRILINTICCV
jgi:hypothetical protein